MCYSSREDRVHYEQAAKFLVNTLTVTRKYFLDQYGLVLPKIEFEFGKSDGATYIRDGVADAFGEAYTVNGRARFVEEWISCSIHAIVSF